MKAFVCLFGVARASNFESVVIGVNSVGTTWKATVPKFVSIDDAKALCGTIMVGDEGYRAMRNEKVDDSANLVIPDHFDVREHWPDCAVVSGHIRDQSDCGSCWAFGSTEALNDRHCIATGSRALLSVEDTMANCGLMDCFSQGCGGGQPGKAWDWFQSIGVVTGGDYGDIGFGDACAPYSLPPCIGRRRKATPTPERPACPESEYPTPEEFSGCKEAAYLTSYDRDKVKAASSYSITGIANIQADILQYGSVTGVFFVYEDFFAYESGVYQYISGASVGGHAIKILGWGVEDGTPYWLCANSWHDDWGDKGFFKMLRGTNHCGIEDQVSAGHAHGQIATVV